MIRRFSGARTYNPMRYFDTINGVSPGVSHSNSKGYVNGMEQRSVAIDMEGKGRVR